MIDQKAASARSRSGGGVTEIMRLFGGLIDSAGHVLGFHYGVLALFPSRRILRSVGAAENEVR